LAGPTGCADTTIEHSLGCNEIAHSEVLYTFSDGDYFTRILMTRDDRKLNGPREDDVTLAVALVAGGVGTTDAAATDLNEDFTWTWLWIHDLCGRKARSTPNLRGHGGLSASRFLIGNGVAVSGLPVGFQQNCSHE